MNTGGKFPVFSPVGGESETAHILSLMGGGVVIQGRKSAETNTFQNRRKEVSNMAVFRIEKIRDYTRFICSTRILAIRSIQISISTISRWKFGCVASSQRSRLLILPLLKSSTISSLRCRA